MGLRDRTGTARIDRIRQPGIPSVQLTLIERLAIPRLSFPLQRNRAGSVSMAGAPDPKPEFSVGVTGHSPLQRVKDPIRAASFRVETARPWRGVS
ncbi:MAG: hypothetical protein CMN75_13325 [Spirochaeta sp.]|nr:hypothetical protein [Spirochaeta sp.]